MDVKEVMGMTNRCQQNVDNVKQEHIPLETKTHVNNVKSDIILMLVHQLVQNVLLEHIPIQKERQNVRRAPVENGHQQEQQNVKHVKKDAMDIV